MDNENSPLHKLFQQLVAEGRLDPALAQTLLEEIQEIIVYCKGLDGDK